MEQPRKERVLVVDDNQDILFSTRLILEKYGYSVQTAENGPQALERLKEGIPSVVLLDWMMPKMSGIEVLKQIRANPATASVPVILVTAKTQDEDMLLGYQHNADYYLVKPASAKQLLYAINLVLGKADLITG